MSAGQKVVEDGVLRVGTTECEAMTSSIGAADTCAPCVGGHSEAEFRGGGYINSNYLAARALLQMICFLSSLI